MTASFIDNRTDPSHNFYFLKKNAANWNGYKLMIVGSSTYVCIHIHIHIYDLYCWNPERVNHINLSNKTHEKGK